MACNICRAPILVNKRYLDPNDMDMVTQADHLNPILKEVCPPSHQSYFRDAVLLDRRMEGVLASDLVHAGLGVFISCQWDIIGGSANAIKQEELDDEGVTKSSVYLMVT
jgi:hypothetical protein